MTATAMALAVLAAPTQSRAAPSLRSMWSTARQQLSRLKVRPRLRLRSARVHHSFEGEANFNEGGAVFRYYKPARGQKLDPAVLRTLLADPAAHQLIRNLDKRRARARRQRRTARRTASARGDPDADGVDDALASRLSWSSLTLQGRSAFLERLFRRETARQLLPEFFTRYRADAFALDAAAWGKLGADEKLTHVTYANLNQHGRKRYKEIMREVFPLYRTRRTPSAFEDVLFFEASTTFELRHRSKSPSEREVGRAVRWMKRHITPAIRPHRHVSFKPDLRALTARRRQFLSFVQRVDLLSFAQRLEKRSKGALYGAYGKNFKPYSASKLRQIDRSLVEHSYSLLLGSKLHAVGLRTYRDGTIGLEVRAVTEAKQLESYVALIRKAITRGAIGELRYDDHPIEFRNAGASLELRNAVSRHLAAAGLPRRGAKDSAINARLAAAGLDERLSYALQRWEQQPFVSRDKRARIIAARAAFIDTLAALLTRHAAGTLDDEKLRDGAMEAVWDFAREVQLSQDIERSLVTPLHKRRGPSLIEARATDRSGYTGLLPIRARA